jgi:hypothetical protein
MASWEFRDTAWALAAYLSAHWKVRVDKQIYQEFRIHRLKDRIQIYLILL